MCFEMASTCVTQVTLHRQSTNLLTKRSFCTLVLPTIEAPLPIRWDLCSRISPSRQRSKSPLKMRGSRLYAPPRKTTSSFYQTLLLFLKVSKPMGAQNVISVSDNPTARIAMMSPASNFFGKTAEAASWRYDSLNANLRKASPLSFETAMDVIGFLSPKNYPTYWDHRFNRADPMSAQVRLRVYSSSFHPNGRVVTVRLLTQVEGAVSLVWMNEKTGRHEMRTKTGYWADPYTRISPRMYAKTQVVDS
eukprot:m.240134 g.240134  ORF g.240134 m.240134 type:complete len:248 (-) comp15820_c0_seq5:1112-1855(-)